MLVWRCLSLTWLAVAVVATTVPAQAITISIDYTYDSSNFFGSGNPQGSAAGLKARNSLEAAANYFSTILDDTFSEIDTPPDFFSSVASGHVAWSWSMGFRHPSTVASTQITLEDEFIAADEYRIYAGARNFTGTKLAEGGTGSFGWSQDVISQGFTQAEINQISQIGAEFEDAVTMRGETSGFARWGGTVAFDSVGTTWHYDHLIDPISGSGTNDFYSTALHELGHALGFGAFSVPPAVSEWDALVTGSNFYGSTAAGLNGGPVPLSADLSHWQNNTSSTVFGSSTTQETAMDPDLTTGMRKRWTTLDAAALTDLGWTVVAPPGLDGDYNENGVIDAGDYTVWRDALATGASLPNDPTPGTVNGSDFDYWRAHFGESLGSGAGFASVALPEPNTLALASLAALLLLNRRGRRNRGG